MASINERDFYAMENILKSFSNISSKSQYQGVLHNGQSIWARYITGEVISEEQARLGIDDKEYESILDEGDLKPHRSNNLYLVGSDKTLRHIDVIALGIRVSVGDRLTVTWGNLEDSEAGPLWHIVNHTYGETHTFLEGAPFRGGWKTPKPPAGYKRYMLATTAFLYVLSLLGNPSIHNLDWLIWLSICIVVYSDARRKFVLECKYEVSRFARNFLHIRTGCE